MTRLPLLCLALLGLSACEPAATAAFAGASLVSLVHTDKSVSDHAISWATDEDCSLLRKSRNGAYCQAPAAAGDGDGRDDLAALSATLYCYRTLGGVSCYNRPDYMASSQTRVDFAHGYAPRPGVPAPHGAAPLAALPDSGTY